MNAFTESAGIPVDTARPVLSYTPVVLDVPGRAAPLEVKVSWPSGDGSHPVLLLSHGHGISNFVASNKGYGPVAEFWAAHGFVVLQPTHLDAMELGLRESGHPDAPLFWRSRIGDLRALIDHLGDIEAVVPGLGGHVDPTRIVAVGHSLGAHTVAMLMGARVLGEGDSRVAEPYDERIAAGVLISPPGIADEFSGPALQLYPDMAKLDFAQMGGASLVITGDGDVNPIFSSRADYRSDAYRLSPGGNKSLLTFREAGHMFGGISGYDAAETTDENPERVAALRALVWAYLRTRLDEADPAWTTAVDAVRAQAAPIATVEER